MVRRASDRSFNAKSMEEFDKTEVIRASELQENEDQADLKFLSGENYRLVPTTLKLLEKTDSMEAKLAEKFESMESKLDTMLDEVTNTLSQLCNQLGIRPIESETSRQISPVIFSDAYVRDDPNRLPLDNRKSLLRKIEMPKFDGSNAYDWLSKVERFFSVGRYSDFDKLDLVALSLEGDVLKWFNWKMICQKFPSWDAFRRRLLWKFRAAPEKSSEIVTESFEEKSSYTEQKLILQYQEMDSTTGNKADVESAHGANEANRGGDIDALPPPPPILPPNVEPLHVKTEPVEKMNLRVPVVSKILDQVHEPYHSDLDGKTFAYGGEKTMSPYGVLPDNKLDFAVVLEEVSAAARPHGNASPNRNENELIHDNLKSHMWHKWKSKHLRPVFDLQTSPSYALDVVNKTSTPWETQNTFASTQVDSVHFLSFEVGTADQLFSGLSQPSQVWEPGGVIAANVLVAWLVDFNGFDGIVDGIRRPAIASRRASRVWERGGLDISTIVSFNLQSYSSWCGWLVFDRGKNNKLQLYRQLSVIHRIHQKLAAKFFDFFLVIELIGMVASKLTDCISLYPISKLEDKLVFGEGSIDKLHQTYYRKKKPRVETKGFSCKEALERNRGFAVSLLEVWEAEINRKS